MTEDVKEHILKIIGANYEFSIEANLKYLDENLDEILDFLKKLDGKLGIEIEIEAPTESEISQVSEEAIPVIKPTRSTTTNVRLLFNTEWGKNPRSLAEVMKSLEVNAVPDKVEAVNTYLRRLVKSGTLRRIQKEGLWHYYKLPDEE